MRISLLFDRKQLTSGTGEYDFLYIFQVELYLFQFFAKFVETNPLESTMEYTVVMGVRVFSSEVLENK